MKARTLARVCSIEGNVVSFNPLTNRISFNKRYGGPTYKATVWMAMLNQALIRANCTTPDRVAMFLAQVGHESGSFRYTEELASGSAYNWRSDLGNTHPGDGERYKGRTYIQITGRYNYTALSAWAHSKGYVPTRSYFVDHPAELASIKYIFLGPVWYWTVARHMNPYADHRDIVGATRAVNGGLNNLDDRRARWNWARKFGNYLLPSGVRGVPSNRTTSTKVSAVTYTVRRGDTLSSIATRFHTTWRRLQTLNHLSNPDAIRIGQRLRVK